jgi:hypothetical protein
MKTQLVKILKKPYLLAQEIFKDKSGLFLDGIRQIFSEPLAQKVFKLNDSRIHGRTGFSIYSYLHFKVNLQNI